MFLLFLLQVGLIVTFAEDVIGIFISSKISGQYLFLFLSKSAIQEQGNKATFLLSLAAVVYQSSFPSVCICRLSNVNCCWLLYIWQHSTNERTPCELIYSLVCSQRQRNMTDIPATLLNKVAINTFFVVTFLIPPLLFFFFFKYPTNFKRASLSVLYYLKSCLRKKEEKKNTIK